MNFDDRLRLCILSGDNEKAQRILEEMDPCNMIDSSGQTLLHLAAELKNEIITKYLLEKGCKVDAVDNNGNTPLILACLQDHTDVIKVLVEDKASVLISNREGKNAADIVLGATELNIFILDSFLDRVKEECSNDSLRTAKELIRVGCPLTRAMRLRDVAVTKYMLDNGCNVNDQDYPLQGWTPLHQALVFRDNENTKLLINRGANLNVEDAFGVTPLSYARDFEMLDILLNKGAKVVEEDGTLVTGDLFSDWVKEVVEMLMTRYNLTDLSIRDRGGTTLFHHLASNRIFDPVEILQKHFDYSFDINQKDHEGRSALLNAVKAGNVKTVEFLLKMGAKFTTNAHHDEIYYAVVRNFRKVNREDREKIMMLLLQYGADIQWSSDDGLGNEYFTLDYALKMKHFAMVKIILARLALVEDLGVEIKKLFRERIENNAMCKKYFEICKRTIEKLKRVVIKRQVSLFDFLACNDETLVKLARSEEFVGTVQSIMYQKRHSNLYYYKVLRQRIKKAVKIVNIRKNISWYMNYLIPELQGNEIVIEKIVEYIIHEALYYMARQPTFKCIVEND